MVQTKQSKVASRLFVFGAGWAILLWLYFINIDNYTIPIAVNVMGRNITKYVLATAIIIGGLFAGLLIRFGLRGGRLKLSG